MTSDEARTEILSLFHSYLPQDDSSNVVLVGHDIIGDTKSLRYLGVDIYRIPNLLEIIDTKDVHSHFTQSDNGTRLSNALRSFNIDYRFLHNAGNDAMYTLQLLLATVLNKRLKTLDIFHGRKDDPGVLGKGWSSNESDDGGKQPPITQSVEKQQQSEN